MTKNITIALTVVSLMVIGAFAADEAQAHPGHLTIKTQHTYVCSIAKARRQYRLAKKDLQHAAADTDFYGKRIARNAIRAADKRLRTPTTATCTARSRRYADAIRTLRRALRTVKAREKPEPRRLRLNLTALRLVG